MLPAQLGPHAARNPTPLSGSEDPSHRAPARVPLADRARPLVGAALAATWPLLAAGVDSGRRRGQKTPPTEPRPELRSRIGHGLLWERPWPRQGRCWPLASIQLAVGVRRPLPQNPVPSSARGSGTASCESGLGRDTAVAGRWLRFSSLSGSEDPSHRIPARAPLADRVPHPCGSGLGRDRAVAGRWLRFSSQSGSEDPSHRAPARAPLADRARPLVGAALAATGPVRVAGVRCGAPAKHVFSSGSPPPAGRTPALRRPRLQRA